MKFMNSLMLSLFISSYCLAFPGSDGHALSRVELKKLSDLKPGDVWIKNEDIRPSASAEETMLASDVSSAVFRIEKDNDDIFIYMEVAEENVIRLQLDIINDTAGVLKHLTCDCNLGIERSIFNHNPDPYAEKVAEVSLKDKGVFVEYSENFKRDFLSISSMSREYFSSGYTIYSR